jgi:hypothetical protein
MVAGAMIPVGYPFVYLPLGVALRFLGKIFSPFLFVAFCFSLMVAIGDPLVFLLHKIVKNLVPVKKPAFFSFQMLIFVLDEGPEANVNTERVGDIEPNILRVPRSAAFASLKPTRTTPVLTPLASTHEPGSIDHLLDISQRSPHEALAWIDRLSSELRSKSTICFARFMALRTLALENLIGSVNLTGVDTNELRQYMSPESGKYLVQALRQISELEQLHPGYIASLGAPDDRFGESSMDDVCIIVERLFPGKIYEVLGWTKIFYFGIDRIGFLSGLKEKIPHELLITLLKTRFDAGEIVRSALAITYGKRNRSSLGYVEFYMCRLLYSETPTIGDAQIAGTLRLSEDSSFTFIPE